MPRFFAGLSIANLLLLSATAAIGIFAETYGVDRHVLLAVLTVIFSCLVQVAAFTYLTVTGKMIGQAVHLARLDVCIMSQVGQYKRRMTRCLAALFVSVILVTASGAAVWRSGDASWVHDAAVALVFVVHVGILTYQYGLVVENASLVRSTLATYSVVRKQRSQSSGITRGA